MTKLKGVEYNDGNVETLIHEKPCKTKINDFINEHEELINAFDDYIVEFARINGLISGEEFAGDETFLDEYSNDFKPLYPDEIRHMEDLLTSNKKKNINYCLIKLS